MAQKYTKAVRDRVVELLERGATRGLASAGAGISQQALMKWMREERPQFKSFQQRVLKAESEFLMKHLEVVIDDSIKKRNTKSSRWLLTYSSYFQGINRGKGKEDPEIMININNNMVDFNSLTTEQKQKELDRMKSVLDIANDNLE